MALSIRALAVAAPLAALLAACECTRANPRGYLDLDVHYTAASPEYQDFTRVVRGDVDVTLEHDDSNVVDGIFFDLKTPHNCCYVEGNVDPDGYVADATLAQNQHCAWWGNEFDANHASQNVTLHVDRWSQITKCGNGGTTYTCDSSGECTADTDCPALFLQLDGTFVIADNNRTVAQGTMTLKFDVCAQHRDCRTCADDQQCGWSTADSRCVLQDRPDDPCGVGSFQPTCTIRAVECP